MRTNRAELKKIIHQIKCCMESERLIGIEELYLPAEEFVCEKKINLEKVKEDVQNCKRCTLHRRRKNVVFGEGNINARLMFIGEAPGREEDLRGLPFVGEAGQLLTRIIEAIKLSRSDVYICNVLKCRPPENRNPAPEEISSCGDYLKQQINLIKPKIICTLGKFAAGILLDLDAPISKLRGDFFDYQGIKVIPTFHPAYLLRNPQAKRLVWQDMKKIAQELVIKLK